MHMIRKGQLEGVQKGQLEGVQKGQLEGVQKGAVKNRIQFIENMAAGKLFFKKPEKSTHLQRAFFAI